MNDLTGGPVQAYLNLAANGVLAVRMGMFEVNSFRLRRIIRARVLAEYPNFRLSMDGTTYH